MIKKKFNKLKIKFKKKISYKKFDLSKNNTTTFNEILVNSTVYVNCSYPKTSNWNQNSFSKITDNVIKNSLNNNLVPSITTAIAFAEYLKKNKKSGSIIQLGSIYGLVGQNPNLYKKTCIVNKTNFINSQIF